MKIICKFCNKTTEVQVTGQKGSNGAFILIDKNGYKVTKSCCHNCRLKNQRLRRRRLKNSETKRYEKTKSGYLMRTYRNMKSRVNGLVKPHLYKGLPILSKEDFYSWSNENDDFKNLFQQWQASGYQNKLSPSIDRIDSSKGYLLNNMRWLTHSQNSAASSKSRSKN